MLSSFKHVSLRPAQSGYQYLLEEVGWDEELARVLGELVGASVTTHVGVDGWVLFEGWVKVQACKH